MTPAETTVFDIPAIGDDLAALDRRGRPKFTMVKLKEAIDACSNPPQFRGVKTPITELLDADDKPKRDAHANPKRDGDRRDHGRKDKGAQLQSRQNTARDFRPAHEKPSAFPPGLKRPDPTSTVEGRKIANDAQRQLFTSRAIAAPDVTKRVTSVPNARSLRKNGRRSSIARK
jgi:hypothetical protein